MSYSNSLNAEERIMLARDDKDHLYEPKPNKKAIRILTVAAYVFCVSLAAIILSIFYVFIWDPTVKPTIIHPKNCDKYVIPENLAIRLANSTEVSPDTFFKMFFKQYPAAAKGQSMPTAIINKVRLFDVKKVDRRLPKEIPVQTIPKEFIESKTKFMMSSTQEPILNEQPQRDDYEEDDDTIDYENESSGYNEIKALPMVNTTSVHAV